MDGKTCFSFLLFCSLVVLCEVVCPYTKVEESFGIQAMHDFLFCQDTSCGDHIKFPGVVPRTFFGSWIISILALLFILFFVKPVVAVAKIIYIWKAANQGVVDLKFVDEFFSVENIMIKNPILMSHLCRLILGGIVCGSLWYFATGLEQVQHYTKKNKAVISGFKMEKTKQKNVKFVFFLLCSLQFHLVYYATRTLPNTSGLIFTTLAFGCALREKYYTSIFFLTAGAAIFRCDMIPLIIGTLFCYFFEGYVCFTRVVFTGLFSLFVAAFFTVFMDSFLWGRWVWPEFVVLLFNSVENKSWLWGRSPWHWYFSFALPRGFLFMYVPLLLLLFSSWWGVGKEIVGRLRCYFFNSLNVYLPSLMTSSSSSTIITTTTKRGGNGRLFSLLFSVGLQHRCLLISASIFIMLYSFLPHKELRFISIVFPLFLAPLALFFSRAYGEFVVCDKEHYLTTNNGKKESFKTTTTTITTVTTTTQRKNNNNNNNISLLQVTDRSNLKPFCKGKIIFILCILLYIVQLFTVIFSLFASNLNYPGSYALNEIHKMIKEDICNNSLQTRRLLQNQHDGNLIITLFIDSYAAMTGINRFQKLHSEVCTGNLHYSLFSNGSNYYSCKSRLFSLLRLPFISFVRVISETRDYKTGRWREYDFSGLTRAESDELLFLSSSSSKKNNVINSGNSSLNQLVKKNNKNKKSNKSNEENIGGDVLLRYEKESLRFDEKLGVYDSQGLNYIIVRHTQREFISKHDEFKEMFTVDNPSVKDAMIKFMSYFFPVDSYIFSFFSSYKTPFLIALRRDIRTEEGNTKDINIYK